MQLSASVRGRGGNWNGLLRGGAPSPASWQTGRGDPCR
eukprot:CAMPEP_0185543264 /NCGR_PEP_ID=MMETSP1381-20130426/3158_1 /TAXON_ID=298111 /ORGANISM="Pavlova sp., Strain CCMP459" /LENGTH=37 /DNA_ID= /DNA_START= /DNA_END= /DNA_ORIENTATION=